MTRAERIQTILRSELTEWQTMNQAELISRLLVERMIVLDDLSSDALDSMLKRINVAEVWSTAL